MALKLVNQAGNPLGQFDGLDGNGSTTGFLSLKGGEVVTFGSTVVPPGDKAAKDSFDGYAPPNLRPVVTRVLAAGSRPLMLADDGISGYGTLFGSVVGGTVGQVVTGGAVLGPHTATGSGKVTCWHLPGVYAVSLDAVDTASDGLVPTNSACVPGLGLTYSDNGLLTPDGSAIDEGGPVIGRFIEFQTSGSLVTTPNSLVGTLSGADGQLSASQNTRTFALFYFNPPAA